MISLVLPPFFILENPPSDLGVEWSEWVERDEEKVGRQREGGVQKDGVGGGGGGGGSSSLG